MEWILLILAILVFGFLGGGVVLLGLLKHFIVGGKLKEWAKKFEDSLKSESGDTLGSPSAGATVIPQLPIQGGLMGKIKHWYTTTGKKILGKIPWSMIVAIILSVDEAWEIVGRIKAKREGGEERPRWRWWDSLRRKSSAPTLALPSAPGSTPTPLSGTTVPPTTGVNTPLRTRISRGIQRGWKSDQKAWFMMGLIALIIAGATAKDHPEIWMWTLGILGGLGLVHLILKHVRDRTPSATARSSAWRLSWKDRKFWFFVGLMLIIGIGVAFKLNPDLWRKMLSGLSTVGGWIIIFFGFVWGILKAVGGWIAIFFSGFWGILKTVWLGILAFISPYISQILWILGGLAAILIYRSRRPAPITPTGQPGPAPRSQTTGGGHSHDHGEGGWSVIQKLLPWLALIIVSWFFYQLGMEIARGNRRAKEKYDQMVWEQNHPPPKPFTAPAMEGYYSELVRLNGAGWRFKVVVDVQGATLNCKLERTIRGHRVMEDFPYWGQELGTGVESLSFNATPMGKKVNGKVKQIWDPTGKEPFGDDF